MGLIQALTGAVGGVLADQWKEYFYCDSLDKDTLVVKGQKRTSGRSTNTKGEDNIISNGSAIAVNDGQCMIIVEQGKVVDFSAEPGVFTYDTSTEPSIFAGNLGSSIIETFKAIGKRFTYGGDTGKDQRVYYFNTKEILDNKFGTATPIPFRVVDQRINFDMDVSVRCNGIYTYRITDPLLFYTNVCSNVTSSYKRSELDATLKSEFVSALQPAFARLSALQIRPNEMITHNAEVEQAMNETLSSKWSQLRGISVVSVSFNSVTLPPEDQEKLQTAQNTLVYANANMAGGLMATAQAQAMKDAAKNPNGALNGFMGMNMAGGGMNAANLFSIGQQQQAQQTPQPQVFVPATNPNQAPDPNAWTCKCGAKATGKFCPECGAKKPEPEPAEDPNAWTCPKCGTKVTGKFCPECGTKKPEEPVGWTCKCGAVNKGKFCSECGEKKPAGVPLYKCDKCGWEPKDPANPPKFCPECGDPFNDDDVSGTK